MSELLPTRRFNTPGGTPDRSKISTSAAAVRGVVEDGLNMTVFPAAKAGAIFHAGMQTGIVLGEDKETTHNGGAVDVCPVSSVQIIPSVAQHGQSRIGSI